MRRRGGSAIVLAGVLALGFGTSSAGAAVTLGQNIVPSTTCIPPAAPNTVINSVSPGAGPQYAAPTAGVITSWSHLATAAPPSFLRLKVARPVTPPLSFQTVGESAREIFPASVLTTFPTRIPVQTGDVIGLQMPTAYACALATPGFTVATLAGDPLIGSTATYGLQAGFQLNLTATFEPDADNDGFGDETQDLCPTDADTTKACRDKTRPETTISKKPKKKDKKKKPSFEFTSSEAGSTFHCSLNGSAFEVCTSPRSVKAKKGLNTFTVFARDAAGNADETPATYSWTFKKPKKK